MVARRKKRFAPPPARLRHAQGVAVHTFRLDSADAAQIEQASIMRRSWAVRL